MIEWNGGMNNDDAFCVIMIRVCVFIFGGGGGVFLHSFSMKIYLFYNIV